MPKAHLVLEISDRLLHVLRVYAAPRSGGKIVKLDKSVYKFGDAESAVAVLEFYVACTNRRVRGVYRPKGFAVRDAGLGHAVLFLEQGHGVLRSRAVLPVDRAGKIAERFQAALEGADSRSAVAALEFLVGIVSRYLAIHDLVHQLVVNDAVRGQAVVALKLLYCVFGLCAERAVGRVAQIPKLDQLFLQKLYVVVAVAALHRRVVGGNRRRRRGGLPVVRSVSLGRKRGMHGGAYENVVKQLELSAAALWLIVNEQFFARAKEPGLVFVIALIVVGKAHVDRVFAACGAYAIDGVFLVHNVEEIAGAHDLRHHFVYVSVDLFRGAGHGVELVDLRAPPRAAQVIHIIPVHGKFEHGIVDVEHLVAHRVQAEGEIALLVQKHFVAVVERALLITAENLVGNDDRLTHHGQVQKAAAVGADGKAVYGEAQFLDRARSRVERLDLQAVRRVFHRHHHEAEI